jgi:hypothetical protein
MDLAAVVSVENSDALVGHAFFVHLGDAAQAQIVGSIAIQSHHEFDLPN